MTISEKRRVTFEDLFGSEDETDDYLREKLISENLKQISLTNLFRRQHEQEDLTSIAAKALSAKSPVKQSGKRSLGLEEVLEQEVEEEIYLEADETSDRK